MNKIDVWCNILNGILVLVLISGKIDYDVLVG